MIKKYLPLLFLSLFLCSFNESSAASTKISDIQFIGNDRISSSTILAYLELDKGDNFSRKKVDESIKALFRTGFFSDIQMYMKGKNLIVNVTENPIVTIIAFDGNKRLEDNDIKDELSIQPNSVFSYAKMQNDIKRILDLYQQSGRYSVKIEPKIIKLDQNRVNLVYEIDEGHEAKIKKINISGNRKFTDSELKDVIVSREERWYRFFSSADIYAYEKLEYDKELLKRFYHNKGYADFKITSSTAEITPQRDSFLITFILEEGGVYEFGNIDIENRSSKITETNFEKDLEVKKAKRYNKDSIDDSVDNITNHLGNIGFPFVDVSTEMRVNKDSKTVDVTFIINDSHKVYLNRINIRNNTRTLDKVIRREFRISEGDPYNISKIQRSKQKIDNLGFFNRVSFKNQRTTAPDRMDLDVEIEEASTGSLNFAAGYNSSSGMLGSISLSENNFLGKGQYVSLGLVHAEKESNVNFSFTEPYFMDKDLSLGFDVFSHQKDYKKQSSFSHRAKGFVLRAGYDLTEYLYHSARYSYRRENIFDVSDNASIYVKGQQGKNLVSLFGHTLTYDRLDSRLDPTEGYLIKLNQDLAGIGGTVNYLSHEFTAAYFKPLYKKDYIFKSVFRAGHITGWKGEDVSINDRFFIGPDYIRGFDIAGIGPRDATTRDSLGGNRYYTLSNEILFPIGLPNEIGMKGLVFNDIGSLHGIDVADRTNVLDKKNIRAAAGIGVKWNSPMGTMSVHYAVPYAKEKFDDERRFYLTIGTRF